MMIFKKKHNLGAYINMLQTKNRSIETIYLSNILLMVPLMNKDVDIGRTV